MKKQSRIVTGIIIFLAVGMILTYSSIFKLANTKTNTPPQQPTAVQVIPKSYTYQGENGKTALQILKEKFSVETKTSSYGEMVTSINGQSADNNHFWAFKVNGKLANQGADQYQTKSSDQISWELTEIK